MELTYHKRSKHDLRFEMGWGSYYPHPILVITCILSVMIRTSCQNSLVVEKFKSPHSPLHPITRNIPTPAPDYGVIQGRIVSPLSASGSLFVYLARITWDPDRRFGAYVLDSSAGLWTSVNPDGSFHLRVPPGDYVIFVGISLESAVPLQEAPDRLYIANVLADRVIDIGTWELSNLR